MIMAQNDIDNADKHLQDLAEACYEFGQELMKIALEIRQKKFMEISSKNGWEYIKVQESGFRNLEKFHFFDYRTIEQKENISQLKDNDGNVVFELCDVTFSEGGLTSKEIYHVTLFRQELSKGIPEFMLKKEELVDRFMDKVRVFGQSKDIDFNEFPEFSNQYLLFSDDENNIQSFFNKELIEKLENKGIELLESNGNSVIMILHDGLLKSNLIEEELQYFDALNKILKNN